MDESDFAYSLYNFIEKHHSQNLIFNEKYEKLKELSKDENFIKKSLFVLLTERSKDEFVDKWKKDFNQIIKATSVKNLQYFSNSVSTIIVPVTGYSWDNISIILQSGVAKNIYFISYQYEEIHIEKVIKFIKSQNIKYSKESITSLKSLGINALEGIQLPEIEKDESNEGLDALTEEDKYIEKSLNAKIWKNYSRDQKNRKVIDAQIVNFNSGNISIVLPQKGKIIQCDIKDIDGKKIISEANHVGVDSLKRGDTIIYPVSGKTDFIDFIADRKYTNLYKLRNNANRWKNLLKNYFESNNITFGEFKKVLEDGGVKKRNNYNKKIGYI